MYYFALATDYDGTLARDGRIRDTTVAALNRLRGSGRKLILVTGRIIRDLLSACPSATLFDCIVGENGAVLYWPEARETKCLGKPVPRSLVTDLRHRGVPLALGEVLAATSQPHEAAVVKAIREHGLELQLSFNKGAVMVLPSGINKGTGLDAALQQLCLSRHNVVGIGDAENDHAFLELCGFSAAVANALPSIREQADLQLAGADGDGVVNLIERLIEDDLASCQPLARHQLLLGTDNKGRPVTVQARAARVLLCGPSSSGKSTLAVALMEGLAEQQYQFCLIDPEGDFEQLEGTVTFGSSQRAADLNESIAALASPSRNVSINLVGIPLDERPVFFARLYTALQKMRLEVGRPHWLLVDEAHHLMPAGDPPAFPPAAPEAAVMVTVSPAALYPAILHEIDVVVATDRKRIIEFCKAVREQVPGSIKEKSSAEALVWFRKQCVLTEIIPARSNITRLRHRRKYAEGELPPDRSFYFRGAQEKLNLRADDLKIFIRLADGVDIETWQYHLLRGDYSRWIREALKDHALADEVKKVEEGGHDSATSRALIRAAIERRYTGPA